MIVLAQSFFATANHIEATFWIVVGLISAGYALRRTGALANRCWLAAFLFTMFGFSDVVEVQTGAWWRPWWLFAWKAVCVLGLLALLADHWRRRARR